MMQPDYGFGKSRFGSEIPLWHAGIGWQRKNKSGWQKGGVAHGFVLVLAVKICIMREMIE